MARNAMPSEYTMAAPMAHMTISTVPGQRVHSKLLSATSYWNPSLLKALHPSGGTPEHMTRDDEHCRQIFLKMGPDSKLSGSSNALLPTWRLVMPDARRLMSHPGMGPDRPPGSYHRRDCVRLIVLSSGMQLIAEGRGPMSSLFDRSRC